MARLGLGWGWKLWAEAARWGGVLERRAEAAG